MTPEEQNLIENLFERLQQADTSPKDPQAEQLIRAKTGAFPSAPYLLAQAVIVQEHALANAQARIAELENRLAAGSQNAPAGGGTFLSGVSRFFGGGNKPTPPPIPQQAPQPQYQQVPQPQYQQVPGTGAPVRASAPGRALSIHGKPPSELRRRLLKERPGNGCGSGWWRRTFPGNRELNRS